MARLGDIHRLKANLSDICPLSYSRQKVGYFRQFTVETGWTRAVEAQQKFPIVFSTL